MKKWLMRLGIVVAVVVAGVFIAIAVASEPLPSGQTGAVAEARAEAMLDAVNADAWAETRAVSWVFANRNSHIWDRDRQLAQVSWDDYRVVLDVSGSADRKRHGKAFHKGQAVEGEQARELVEAAYGAFINDSFWLNPVPKIFDDGVTRSALESDGQPALLASYSSGGLTPGDAYLWLLDRSNRPTAWRMWVSIVPVGGVEVSWDGWQQLETGAWISTVHDMGPVTLTLSQVRGAKSLDALLSGSDPFEVLGR